MTENRREFIKRLAGHSVYVSPVFASMLAPTNLLGQTSGMMMMTFCDYFPRICEIFGWAPENQSNSGNMGSSEPKAGPQRRPPGSDPGYAPPPSSANPRPGSQPTP